MLDLASIAGKNVRPISRAEYDRMVAMGWFEDERVELLDGILVAMSPQGPLHSKTVQRLAKLLTLALGDRADVYSHSPHAASDQSEPEPDVNVVPPDDDSEDHPNRSFLVIEVAQSSLTRDRDSKARIYADSNIPEYWIVNLVDRVIEVYADPRDGTYQSKSTHGRGEIISPIEFPDVEIVVSDVV